MTILLFFSDKSIFPVYWIIQIQLAIALSELMFPKFCLLPKFLKIQEPYHPHSFVVERFVVKGTHLYLYII